MPPARAFHGRGQPRPPSEKSAVGAAGRAREKRPDPGALKRSAAGGGLELQARRAAMPRMDDRKLVSGAKLL